MGEMILERELKRDGLGYKTLLKDGTLEKIAESFSLKTVEDLLSSIGYGRSPPAKCSAESLRKKRNSRPAPQRPPAEDSRRGGQTEQRKTSREGKGSRRPSRPFRPMLQSRSRRSGRGIHHPGTRHQRACQEMPEDFRLRSPPPGGYRVGSFQKDRAQCENSHCLRRPPGTTGGHEQSHPRSECQYFPGSDRDDERQESGLPLLHLRHGYRPPEARSSRHSRASTA